LRRRKKAACGGVRRRAEEREKKPFKRERASRSLSTAGPLLHDTDWGTTQVKL
jgi:hypothetical protein